MREVALYVSILLVPVILLLFMALRLRKKIIYPHGLLPAPQRKKPTDFLIRLIRLYGDLAIDAALAVAVGIFLAGLPVVQGSKTAIVLDCSLSMTRGLPGARPLDIASREIFNNPELASSDLYLLWHDQKHNETKLTPADKIKKAFKTPILFVRELERRNNFFAINYSSIFNLDVRKYAKVELLTDNADLLLDKIGIRLLKNGEAHSSYPAQASFDPTSGENIIHFYSKDASRLEQVLFRTGQTEFIPATASDYMLEKSPSGFTLRVKKPGIWAILENGRMLPFNAPGRPGPAVGEGALGTKIGAILSPTPTRTPDAGFLLKIKDRRNKKETNAISVASYPMDNCVLDPGKTLGIPVAAGYARKADVALTQTSLASADAALFFFTKLNRSTGVTNAIAEPGDPLMRAGDGYVILGKDKQRAMYASPEEYFPFPQRLEAGPSDYQLPRYYIFLLLLVMYGLKTALMLRRLKRAVA